MNTRKNTTPKKSKQQLKKEKTTNQKELASRILELNKYLNDSPHHMASRSERTQLIDKLCRSIISG